jgi:hypothetical protein
VKDEKEIAKYIDSISFLAGLFDVKIKVKPMPIEVDIKKLSFINGVRKKGNKKD